MGSHAFHAYGSEGFWSRVDKSGGEDACWPWLGSLNAKGYGRRYFQGRARLAHGVAYVLSGRTVPDGYTIDHLCRNRGCQNPKHLEAVPHRENLLRGNTISAKAASTTVCPQGHPYDAENTAIRRGRRVCRACDRARAFAAYRPREKTHRRRPHLTPSEIQCIKDQIACGLSHSQIAAAMSVSTATVSRARNR